MLRLPWTRQREKVGDPKTERQKKRQNGRKRRPKEKVRPRRNGGRRSDDSARDERLF
jgi:hypothetical protein